MEDSYSLILQRRTTRKFQEKQVPQELLEKVLDAGIYAPSAHNQQSWHFVALCDSQTLRELSTACKKQAQNDPDTMIRSMASQEQFDVFYHAPVLILVCGAMDNMMPIVDCAAATENMLLAAESLGLGTCWNGFLSYLFSSEKGLKAQKLFQIPEGYTVLWGVVLGYKEKEQNKLPQRDKKYCILKNRIDLKDFL